VLAAPAAAAAARWSAPFGISAPVAADLAPAQLALSPTGAAVGFAAYQEDDPAGSRAELAASTGAMRLGPARPLAGAGQVLALAYLRGRLWLLLGSASGGSACCRTVQIGALGSRRRTILTGIAGTTEGWLEPVGRRLLAVIATAQGVWVAQSNPHGRFAAARRLSAPGEEVDAAAVAVTPAGRSAVAFTEQSSAYAPGPSTVWLARGTASAPPARRRPAFSVPAGAQVDELALAAGRRGLTAAWVQGSFDRFGAWHSRLYVADLRGRVTPRLLSPGGQLASGLQLAAAPGGAQVVAFDSCTADGSCFARGALRRPGGAFGSSRKLGAADPGQPPAAAESPGGRALLVFAGAGGAVLAAGPAAGAGGFGAPRMLARAGTAAAPAVAFAPSGDAALAVWAQGTARERLVGARLGVRER
jgi:hypothetical protein